MAEILGKRQKNGNVVSGHPRIIHQCTKLLRVEFGKVYPVTTVPTTALRVTSNFLKRVRVYMHVLARENLQQFVAVVSSYITEFLNRITSGVKI